MVVSTNQQSRPPDQYLASSGTLACLVPNEYDRNVYAECAYIGNRTLIKCRQVRRKEELASNAGQCELHTKLSCTLKRRYLKEKSRLSLEGQKKKYRKVLQTEEVVSDEDDFLRPCSHWAIPKQDSVFFLSAEDDTQLPITNAGVFTDKEVLRARISLLQREIKHLENYREMTIENARRTAECSLEPTKAKKKRASLDNAQLKDYLAKRSYNKQTVMTKRLKAMKKHIISQAAYCSYAESDDAAAISDVMGKLISSVAEDDFIPIKMENSMRCLKFALPGSSFCTFHYSAQRKNSFFNKCDSCDNVVLNTNDPTKNLCAVHAYKASHRYPLSISIGGFSTRGSQPTSDVSPSPYFFDYDSDDDLTNEIRQNFDISAIRAGRGRIRHSPYPNPKIPGMVMSPTTQSSTAVQSRLREVDTYRAARCRPFNRENFPEKTHRSAVSRTPTMCLSRPVRPSLPFNPMPMKARTYEAMKRPGPPSAPTQQMRPLFTTQQPPRPQPSPRTYNMPNMTAYNPRAHVPRETTLLQRKQIEEDQKAAASILDDKIEEELVEDREPSPMTQPHSTLPPNQRFVTGSRIPPPSRSSIMPVRTTYSTLAPGTAIPQQRTVYRGMAINDPKRIASFAPLGQPGVARSQTVSVRGGIQRNYSMSTNRRTVGIPTGTLDLSQLPPSIQDKPLGEVLKMQYQGRSVLNSPPKLIPEPINVSSSSGTTSYISSSTMSKLPAPSAPNPMRPTGLLPSRADEASRLPPHRLIKHNIRPVVPTALPAPTKFVVANSSTSHLENRSKFSPPMNECIPNPLATSTPLAGSSLLVPTTSLPKPTFSSSAPPRPITIVTRPSIPTVAPARALNPTILAPSSQAQSSVLASAPTSSAPTSSASVSVPAPTPVHTSHSGEPPAKKEKIFRVGQRRSSRLDKSYDDADKDPLSILAEQAIRGEDKPLNSVSATSADDDDEEYDEEL